MAIRSAADRLGKLLKVSRRPLPAIFAITGLSIYSAATLEADAVRSALTGKEKAGRWLVDGRATPVLAGEGETCF